MSHSIDLNADLGESFGAWTMGDDAALLDIVTSANIACGFHAGDPTVMTETVRLCLEKDVGIGAHPGFDDLRGFGRRRILGLSSGETTALLLYQIGALQAIARGQGQRVRHVKLHGALSNMASEEAPIAEAYVAAAQAADPDLIVVAMATTELEKAVERSGMRIARELYADRAYNPDGTLVSRGQPGAMIHDPEVAAERVLRMVEEQAIPAVDGSKIPTGGDSVCVHGDGPEAIRTAERIRERLDRAGVTVRRFGEA
ncbi:MAG: 5-oxoprolinase subunit PxpA [Rhodospirillales bacterium]